MPSRTPNGLLSSPCSPASREVSRGGLATKIQAMVDTNDLPTRLTLATGPQHDRLSAIDLLDGAQAGGELLPGKVHDSDTIKHVTTQYEKWEASFLALAKLAAARISLRVPEATS